MGLDGLTKKNNLYDEISNVLAKKVDKSGISDKILMLNTKAEVAELADALRSGRSGQYAREGSNPSFGTYPTLVGFFV